MNRRTRQQQKKNGIQRSRSGISVLRRSKAIIRSRILKRKRRQVQRQVRRRQANLKIRDQINDLEALFLKNQTIYNEILQDNSNNNNSDHNTADNNSSKNSSNNNDFKKDTGSHLLLPASSPIISQENLSLLPQLPPPPPPPQTTTTSPPPPPPATTIYPDSHLRKTLFGMSTSSVIRMATQKKIDQKIDPSLLGSYTWDKKNNHHIIPEMFHNMYAISMDARRYNGLKQRLGPWNSYLNKLVATNGKNINTKQWKKKKWIKPHCKLKRGEMGCYRSHVRLWNLLIKQNKPCMLIMEDDADVVYSKQMSQRLLYIDYMIKEHSQKLKYDILYLGHNQKHQLASVPVKGFGVRRGCMGCFAYIITLEGAKKLVQRCTPYNHPLDVFTAKMFTAGHIRALTVEPSLCYVVPVVSTTSSIK